MVSEKFEDLQGYHIAYSNKAHDQQDSLSKSSKKTERPLDWQLTSEFKNCIEQTELQLARLTELLHSVHA
jgi:hypothetical protein